MFKADGTGYGVIRSLAEAQKAAQDAKRDGLLGYYPAACVVLAEALNAALGLLDAANGVALGDGAERRVEAVIEKLRRCSLGCGPFGQCKAAMHGVPSECPAAGVRGTYNTEEKKHG